MKRKKEDGADNALLIFIKNPIPGKVKTRLASSVGDEEALRIYRELLGHTRKVTSAVDTTRCLYYSHFIDEKDEWNPNLFQKHLQYEGDLGMRMSMAFKDQTTNHSKAIIIGSDCAQITASIIQDAFNGLDESDVVIGPSFDGGYYLLGMNSWHPGLFQDIEWSTSSVYESTLSSIKSLGLTYRALPTLSDIDYLEDWQKYGW